MAVPKKKVSSARRDSRRSSNSKLTAPTLELCKCGEYKVHGRVCPKCGMLNGETIVSVTETK